MAKRTEKSEVEISCVSATPDRLRTDLRRLTRERPLLWYRLLLSHLGVAVIALQAGVFYKLRVLSSPCHPGASPEPEPFNEQLELESNFPPQLSQVLTDTARVDVKDFLNVMKNGAPLHPSNVPWKPPNGATQMTILYTSSINPAIRNASGERPFPQLSLEMALGNCREIRHVILSVGSKPVSNRGRGSCLAILGQAESYHTSKFVKRIGNRHLEPGGRYESPVIDRTTWNRIVPNKYITMTALADIHNYLDYLDEALEGLKPVAEKVARAGSREVAGVIVVLVCNFGHADLLINFICASKKAGLNLDKLLVIATDQMTHDLATGLGVASFYNERIFVSIPTVGAPSFGDKTYARIMMSKIYSVHLVSQLQYDILFQDVDIVPYQPDYLEYFVRKARTENFDLYFQNDFNSRQEFAPWGANSGCYYAVNNERTRYFFSAMALIGERVTSTRSHQAAMHTVLNEHATHVGLRIKNLIDDHKLLPMGWHYQSPSQVGFMKSMVLKKPLSFHMNWNINNEVKQKFLEQMGDWYVQPVCTVGKTAAELRGNATGTSLFPMCCSASPLVKCNFRDKPSVISCKDSPPFENGKSSFW